MKFKLPVVVLIILVLISLGIGLAIRRPPVEGNDYARLDVPIQGPVLVVLAHPDDESVACGGLLADLARLGVPCAFIFMTNGEAFQWSVEQESESLLVEPAQYVTYATKRQQEVHKVLDVLGWPNAPLYFLGYPDRGLKPMFLDHRSRQDPYFSPILQTSVSPFEESYSRPVFAGESALADLERILRQVRPKLLITHSSFDTHTDHWATSGFVQEALCRLQEDPGWQAPEVLEFLVHRGNWPGQTGVETLSPLIPPPPLRFAKENWVIYPLSSDALQLKERAIETYATQLTVMNDYLLSFLRSNELFFRPPPHPVGSWQEPVLDTLWRTLFGGADFQSAAVAWQDGLVVTLGTRTDVPARIDLNLDLLLLYPDRTELLQVRNGNTTSLPAGSLLLRQGTRFVLSVPLVAPPTWAMVDASSRYAATDIDQTALWLARLDTVRP